MILESKQKTSATTSAAADLALIINEFSDTLTAYECENKLPIAMWVEIENKKNHFIRIMNVINPNNVDMSLYDPNWDINNSVAQQNNAAPYTTNYGPSSSGTNRSKNNNCSFCNPIKIDYSFKLSKPEISASLQWAIDSSSSMYSSNSQTVCATALAMSQGCIPDIVRIIGMLLMALNLIIESVNLGSLSLSSFLSGSIGAVLNIALKRAMFMANISISKSDCLSSMIKEIINSLPTSQSLNNRIDPELLKKFKLYNENPTDLNKMYQDFEDRIFNQGVDGINTSLTKITETVDDAIQRVNEWIEGLFGLSKYLPCEEERSTTHPSDLLEKVSQILTLINTLSAIINKKNSKCDDTTLTPDDIVDVINSLIDIDTIIQDSDGHTIGIILPSVELQTVYLDTFGCNLPTFMDFLTQQDSPGISPIGNSPLASSNTEIGENELSDTNYDDTFSTSDINGPTIRTPTQNYGARKPTVVNINEVPTDILQSGQVINLVASIDLIKEVVDNINLVTPEGDGLQLIVNSNEEQNTDTLIEPEAKLPNSVQDFATQDIDDMIAELDNMSSGTITIKTDGECK